MARENGISERILDTRLELHILEYNLRMATIAKDAIANYTHYLIKIALLPNSRPGFFSFTESKEDYSLTLEEKAFQELPKSSGLSCSECLWNVLTVSAGAMDCTGHAMGISKIVNSIILPLADNGVSLFCMSTYQGDFILVKQQDLVTAIRCLSGRFKIFDEAGYHNLAPKINDLESRLDDYDSDCRSHPLVHSIVSPLNQFHIISLNSQHFQSLMPTLIDLMFYSSTRTPPSEGHETFFHFSFIDGDLSVVLDDKDLARIPSNYFYTSSFREQWRIIKIGEYPLGFDEYGVVAQIAEPLVEAKITTFYISSCHLGNTLVPEEDLTKALAILNERRKRAQLPRSKLAESSTAVLYCTVRMASKLFVVISFVFLGADVCSTGSTHIQHQLLDHLFKNNSNQHMILPVLNYSDAMTVKFGITLIKIKDVNAKEQTIQVHVWVTQEWMNPFLRWDNVSKFKGISSINVKPSKVWIPDIILYHNVDEQDRTGGGEETYKTLIKLHSDGRSMWSSPSLFKAICEIDVAFFPLDQQTCRLKFGSWTYDSSKLKLTTKENATFPSSDYIKNGEWGIYKVETKTSDHTYEFGEEYMDVTMTIDMKRQHLDYMINLVIPCLMISCMTFLGFILPPESGERVGLSITVLLAMTVFQQLTSEIMPSYGFPLLGQYYFATILEIGGALLITTIILNFYHRTNRHMPGWLRVFLLEWMSRIVFLHESAEKCDKSRKKTIKRGMRENVDAVVNNGYAIGEHPRDADIVGATRTQYHENGREADENHAKPTNDHNVLKLTLGTIGNEFNSQNVQNEKGMFIDETGASVSEEEMRMRHQQWTLAAKVLDRFFLWGSAFIGIATILGIFLRAPGIWDDSVELT